MQDSQSFAPNYKRSVPVAGGASVQGALIASVTVAASAAAAASTEILASPGANNAMQIANTTTAWAYVNFGNLRVAAVTAAAVATGYPVAPGAVVVVTVDQEVNGASVILGAASTGDTSVIFTRGVGL
jgi:redox-sensitive bicupin YhaK (pirin superfamily)